MDVELAHPPSDGISSLHFNPDFQPNLLLSASWDASIRLYDVYANTLLHPYTLDAPVLDAKLVGADVAYCGGLDCRVTAYNFASNVPSTLTTHDAPVKAILHHSDSNMVLSGSWDKTLRLLDPNAPTHLISSHNLPGKVYAMSIAHNYIAVAMEKRHIYIYDVRSMKEPFQRRESALKYQTRAIACLPSGEGYVVTSIEGRVAVEYFDSSAEAQAKKYAFKSHRKSMDGKDIVYPIHSIAFHPRYGTFATGGGDGVVNVWDGVNKKRIRQFPAYPSSISSMAFNCDGSMLAIASSYAFEEGEKDHPTDAIFIKAVADVDVRPKHL